jgi:hypothetical protein
MVACGSTGDTVASSPLREAPRGMLAPVLVNKNPIGFIHHKS